MKLARSHRQNRKLVAWQSTHGLGSVVYAMCELPTAPERVARNRMQLFVASPQAEPYGYLDGASDENQSNVARVRHTMTICALIWRRTSNGVRECLVAV